MTHTTFTAKEYTPSLKLGKVFSFKVISPAQAGRTLNLGKKVF